MMRAKVVLVILVQSVPTCSSKMGPPGQGREFPRREREKGTQQLADFPGSKFWETKGFGLTLKDGASHASAIREFFDPDRMNKSQLDCASAMVVNFRRTLLDMSLNDNLFDTLTAVSKNVVGWEKNDASAGNDRTGKFIPGDRAAFLNPDGVPGFESENTIYLGAGMYYGHGIGIKNEANMIKALNALRVEDATLDDGPKSISLSLLGKDFNKAVIRRAFYRVLETPK